MRKKIICSWKNYCHNSKVRAGKNTKKAKKQAQLNPYNNLLQFYSIPFRFYVTKY